MKELHPWARSDARPDPNSPARAARRLRVLNVAWLSMIFAALGCTNPTVPTGSLEVRYVLGNDRPCEALGIQTIRGVIDDEFVVEEVPCAESDGVRFENLPRGTYRVTMYGLSEDGYSVMDSLGGPDILVKVPGEGATAIAPMAVVLTAAPARILVTWDFGFGSCEIVKIATFLVRAWNIQGDDLLLEVPLACDTAGIGAQQYREIPDPERRLGGTLVAEVSVQPLLADGAEFGHAASFSFDPPGAGVEVRLTVECSQGGCEGSGFPDNF